MFNVFNGRLYVASWSFGYSVFQFGAKRHAIVCQSTICRLDGASLQRTTGRRPTNRGGAMSGAPSFSTMVQEEEP